MNERAGGTLSVRDALLWRRSVRAYLPKPVRAELVRDVIETALAAPSGGNLQPWSVCALSGDPLAALVRHVAENGQGPDSRATGFYPPNLWEPYRTRRREAANRRTEAMVDAEGGASADAVFRRNFRFFNAPVGLFFLMDGRMKASQNIDLGIFLQTVMLLAAEQGLGTCAQAVWANQDRIVRAHLGIADPMRVVVGMALGYPDRSSSYCAVTTDRAPFEETVDLRGFTPVSDDRTGDAACA